MMRRSSRLWSARSHVLMAPGGVHRKPGRVRNRAWHTECKLERQQVKQGTHEPMNHDFSV